MRTCLLPAVLGVTLAASLVWDLRTGRIPNFITFPAILVGLALGWLFEGLPGLAGSAAGMALGGGLLMIPFALGGIGAGDVKLMASVGALMGWRFSLAGGLYAFLIGGLISLIRLASSRQLGALLRDLVYLGFGGLRVRGRPGNTFPYSTAIAGGCALALVLGTRGPLPWLS